MDLLEYTAYFEGLAAKLKAIGHTPEQPRFQRLNTEELFSKLRSTLNFNSGPVLLLENYDGLISRNESDQVFDDRRCAFLIVRGVKATDYAGEQAAAIEAEAIGKKIIARMNSDARQGIGLADYSAASGDWSYQRVAGILDNCHGYRFEFTVSEGAALVIDNADWSA